MKDKTLLNMIALIIVLVGGINTGLMGLFNVNLIFAIFGLMLSRLLFIIVGVAAGYLVYAYYIDKGTPKL